MSNITPNSRWLTVLALAIPVLILPTSSIAQPAAFTYQGFLTVNGAPANAIYDLRFTMYGVASGGAPIASAVDVEDTGVTNGLFTVTLDFGASVFDGSARWLDIAVRPGASMGAYTNLVPRQPVTATPYAVKAGNAMTVDMGAISDPTFIGTTTTAPLQLQVSNTVGLRLEYPTLGSVPNIVGGYSGNSVGAITQGAVIAGGGASGGANSMGVNTDYSAISGGVNNYIADDARWATIAGGHNNNIGANDDYSAIGGGYNNSIGANSVGGRIAGGQFNDISENSTNSTIGGGYDNNIASNCWSATISGGRRNEIGVDSYFSAIGGGSFNRIAENAEWTTLSGGYFNDIGVSADYSVIGGGHGNTISGSSESAIIAGGANNNIGVNSFYSAIGGGAANTVASNSFYATIAGGWQSTIGVNSTSSTVGGGWFNSIASNSGGATISGGAQNTIATNAAAAVIPGGYLNAVGAGATNAFAAGYRAKANHPGAFVWADSQNADFASTGTNQFLIRAAGGVAIGTNDPAGAMLRVAGTVLATSFNGSVAASNLTGTIAADNIRSGSITSSMLASGAVTSAKLDAGAVTTSALAEGAVTAAKVNTTSDWLPLTIPNPNPATEDFFGTVVAPLGEDRLIVGEPSDNTGAANSGVAHLFRMDGTRLLTLTNPVPEAESFLGFGEAAAALGGDRLIVGAGSGGASDGGIAYLYSTNGAVLATFTNPMPSFSDNFGSAVAGVGSDRVLIGASGENAGNTGVGIAYLFHTNGSLLATFNSPSIASGESFGRSVAAVGTNHVLISALGNDAGAVNAGAAHLFTTAGALITTFTNPTPESGDSFGWSLAVLGTDRVVIGSRRDSTGAPAAGAAYLFATNGTLLTTFTNPFPSSSNFFGHAVSSVGSNRILISATTDSFFGAGTQNAGAAYLFDTNGTLLASFNKPNPHTRDLFGFSVAGLGANTLLIGSPRADLGATGAGAVYLFRLESYAAAIIAEAVPSGSISTSSLAEGAVTADKISGVLYDSHIPNLDASKITSGVLSTNRIPNLDAAKLTSGTLADARLSDNVVLEDQANFFLIPQYFAAGFESTPGITFNVDGDTGLWRPAANTLGMVTGGAERMRVTSSSISAGLPVLLPSGSAASPALAFSDDADTGILNPSANTLGLATGGVERMRVTSAGRLGLGTNNPAAHLHVGSAGSTPQLLLSQNDSANAFTRLRLAVGGTNLWDIAAGGNNNVLNFFYGPASNDRMTLDASGNLFIDGTLNPPSDRNVKQDFAPVDPVAVLEKVAALPVQTWAYKHSATTRHIGPVAQDFKAAFGLGATDTSIATVDADGVALAAIQGLNQKLTEELKRRDAENAALKRELAEIKTLLKTLAR